MTNNEILIKRIQSVLTDDLLNKDWIKRKKTHPLEGHCYIATEVLFHLLEPDEWKPMCASYQEDGLKSTHWWLEGMFTNEILDPTKEQYGKDGPPYSLGKGCGLLTKTPSKRARVILDRVDRIYGELPQYI